MSNMFGMLKKAQEMQKGLQTVQAELAKTEVDGQAASGAVKVTINGTHEILKVSIQPSVVDTDDLGMLEDLVKVAFNDALAKANELAKSKMAAVTGGLGIPGF
ncbi:MAG: YbaB/EbfC family nucleoid-associated protein [Alphaproteobacteria bacterium]|nr:MAG: YbaB/EbfC family nucleoid-associated protein [Alphaproteobacteria bacterium]RYG61531.1 MAG: YbaB/EbfC family nucleoid-associated protein [Alphaproteobacteria bacterium]